MDQTNGQYIGSKEEFQTRMDEGRHLMAETMGEIKHELSEAVEWKTYVQRYPGTCLLAGGALGWILGRRLGSFRQSPLSSSQPNCLFSLPNPRRSQERRTRWFRQSWQRRFL